MPKQVRHDNLVWAFVVSGAVAGFRPAEEEMPKQVQHDNFVWFRWGKKLSGVYDYFV